MARAWLWMSSLCATLLIGQGASSAAEEPPALEADFLEFLGSWDSEDEAWTEFLASTEIPEASEPEEEESRSEQVDP